MRPAIRMPQDQNDLVFGLSVYRLEIGKNMGHSAAFSELALNGSSPFLGHLSSAATPPLERNMWRSVCGNISMEDQIAVYPENHYSSLVKLLIGIILSLIIVIAVCGNTLVIVAILTDRNLRKTNNYFIISLAVADTLVAVLVMTFAVANDVIGYWVFGSVFCNIWLSFDVMFSTASILNLCAISFDRFLHIQCPLRYPRRMTVKRCILAIGCVWFLSALISFLPVHLGWHVKEHERTEVENLLNSTSVSNSTATPVAPPIIMDPSLCHGHCVMELNPSYAVTSSIISFFFPCIVMLIFYTKLYQIARRHTKNIKRSWASGQYSPATRDRIHPLATGQGDISQQNQYKLQDHKAALTLGVIMGTFLICWLPFFTVNIISAFCTPCIPPLVTAIFTWLGYLNSTMNPFIFSIFNVEFREAFKRVLSLRVCNKGHIWHRDFVKTGIRYHRTTSATGSKTTDPTNNTQSRVKLKTDCVPSL